MCLIYRVSSCAPCPQIKVISSINDLCIHLLIQCHNLTCTATYGSTGCPLHKFRKHLSHCRVLMLPLVLCSIQHVLSDMEIIKVFSFTVFFFVLTKRSLSNLSIKKPIYVLFSEPVSTCVTGCES